MRFALTMVVVQRERKQAAFERYLPNLFSGGWDRSNGNAQARHRHDCNLKHCPEGSTPDQPPNKWSSPCRTVASFEPSFGQAAWEVH